MNTTEVQLLIAIITVLGSGVSVYVGVRVALAEIRGDIKRLDAMIETIQAENTESKSRIIRLENEYFKNN